MHLFTKKLFLNIYEIGISLLGLYIFCGVFLDNSIGNFSVNFLILMLLSYFSALKASIKVKFFRGVITFSDIFVFIAIFTLGNDLAILVAVAEVFAIVREISKKVSYQTAASMIGAIVVRTFLTIRIFEAMYGDPVSFLRNSQTVDFTTGLSLLAIIYSAIHFTMSTVAIRLRSDSSRWKAAFLFQLWAAPTMWIGGAMAGIFLKIMDLSSVLGLILCAAILLCFYVAFNSYIQTFDALKSSESKFRSSFDHAPIGMAIISDKKEWIQINDQFSTLLKLEKEILPSENFIETIYKDDVFTFNEKIDELVTNKVPSFQAELRLLDESDEIAWVLLGASKAMSSDGENINIILQVQDITARKKAEEMLRYDAYHDSLTGLKNRSSFLVELQNSIKKHENSNNNFCAVFFIDLDNFKIINDSLGHNVGDEILKITAQKLLESVHGHDIVARFGGDEFTILLNNIEDVSQAIAVAERILKNFSTPFQLESRDYLVGLSIGISINTKSYQSADEMLRDADAAMYKSKSQGKNIYSIFDNTLFLKTNRTLQVINDLPKGIENNEIQLNFQPIHDLQNNDLLGFEALSRWQHPTYGLIPPVEFISLAEEFGVISHLDNWVLLNACKQIKEWQGTSPNNRNLSISVNISPKQFALPDFYDSVKSILECVELSPSSLQIEITETALIKNLQKASETLAKLNMLGVKVALDDFGTGYSSLSYLRELPVGILKIDRSFIQKLDSNSNDKDILETIITLASKLKIQVTAEGIETHKQFEYLCEMGCNFGQGYYFSRPVNASEAYKYLILSENSKHQFISTPTEKTLLQLVK